MEIHLGAPIFSREKGFRVVPGKQRGLSQQKNVYSRSTTKVLEEMAKDSRFGFARTLCQTRSKSALTEQSTGNVAEKSPLFSIKGFIKFLRAPN